LRNGVRTDRKRQQREHDQGSRVSHEVNFTHFDCFSRYFVTVCAVLRTVDRGYNRIPFRSGPAPVHFACAGYGALRYRLANSMKYGQFGAGVWPPLCWRKAMSPEISAVSIGRKTVVPVA
jgi:hypothetical protein